VIEVINRNHFNTDKSYLGNNKKIDKSSLKDILEKLKEVFSSLTGTEQFKDNNDLKYFYLKDDISKIVNEQIFLILGAKGSGKSTLFEVFTKHHKDILSRLNIGNNSYLAGFSKTIMGEISKDYISNIYQKSNKKIDIERFWKCLTLLKLEKELNQSNMLFENINDISNKFTNIEIGLEADKRLKNINISLIQEDRVVTLVYDELDIGFTEETKKIFITTLVSFWQDNIYKYSQIRSKIY
jgi:ABC-type lipoprotein export system ATPase subunit